MLALSRNKYKSGQIAGTRACPMGGAAEAWGARDNAGADPRAWSESAEMQVAKSACWRKMRGFSGSETIGLQGNSDGGAKQGRENQPAWRKSARKMASLEHRGGRALGRARESP
jgi:hypothetical protein